MPLTFQALPLHEASCRGTKQCAAVTQTKIIEDFLGLFYGKSML